MSGGWPSQAGKRAGVWCGPETSAARRLHGPPLSAREGLALTAWGRRPLMMPNRNLKPDELEMARALLHDIREKLTTLAGDDPELLFAYRRKIAKQLIYDERSALTIRRKLNSQKRREQSGLCASRTRFTPEKLLALFERTNWPIASPGLAARGPSQGPRIGIGARVRGMWR
jgi:hypothetical protein